MDSKPELTNLQRSQIDEMVSMAGELLFEAGTGNRWARNVLKELAHHLGRLYGETIRTCRGYDGLRDEVQTTFMCGMALEPNFGREEEAKSAGRLLFEKECGPSARPWDKLDAKSHLAFEREAEVRAKSYSGVIRITEEKMCDPKAEEVKAAMQKVLDAPVGTPLPPDSPFATIDWEKAAEKTRPYDDADAKLCWKCKGTKDMGFTTRVACDAC